METTTTAILSMRVSSRTEPAKLGSAITHQLRENAGLEITVSAIGETAEAIAVSAMEIANSFAVRDRFKIAFDEAEKQFEVEDRTPGAKPGAMRDTTGRQFTVWREDLPMTE